MHSYGYLRDVALDTERTPVERSALPLTLKGVTFSRGSSTTAGPFTYLLLTNALISCLQQNRFIDHCNHVALKDQELLGENTSNRVNDSLDSGRLVSLNKHPSLWIRRK